MPQRSGWLGTERKCHSAKKEKKRKEKEASIYSYARHCHICYFIGSTQIYRVTPAGGYFYFYPPFFSLCRWRNGSSGRLGNQSKVPQLVSDRVTNLGLSFSWPKFLPRPHEIHHPPKRQRNDVNTEEAPEHSQALAATHPSINVFFNNEIFSAS